MRHSSELNYCIYCGRMLMVLVLNIKILFSAGVFLHEGGKGCWLVFISKVWGVEWISIFSLLACLDTDIAAGKCTR